MQLSPASRRGHVELGNSARIVGTAAVYLAGALVYFLLVEVAGVDFLITPVFFGGMMLVASVLRPRLLASAILLLAWGAAVLLVEHEVLAHGRASSSYMAAFGLAALVLLLLRRWIAIEVSLESAAIILLAGGVALYLSGDITAFGRGWLWAAATALNAIVLLVVEWRRRGQPTRDGRTAEITPDSRPLT